MSSHIHAYRGSGKDSAFRGGQEVERSLSYPPRTSLNDCCQRTMGAWSGRHVRSHHTILSFQAADMGDNPRIVRRGPCVHTISATTLDDLEAAARHESQHSDDVYTDARQRSLCDEFGDTALHVAAHKDPRNRQASDLVKYGHPLEALLQHWAPVDARNHYLETPLLVAAKAGNVLASKQLIEAGANIALQDIDGNNALDIAQATSNDELAAWLLERGAQPMSIGTDEREGLQFVAGNMVHRTDAPSRQHDQNILAGIGQADHSRDHPAALLPASEDIDMPVGPSLEGY